MNQSLGPVNRSNSSLGSYSASKASASSSGTRGEYRMAPIRKSFHESALNCFETTLHLYLVPGTPSFIPTFSIYRETDFPTTLEPATADSAVVSTRRFGAPPQCGFFVALTTETVILKSKRNPSPLPSLGSLHSPSCFGTRVGLLC